jgi:hypothetical protein
VLLDLSCGIMLWILVVLNHNDAQFIMCHNDMDCFWCFPIFQAAHRYGITFVIVQLLYVLCM